MFYYYTDRRSSKLSKSDVRWIGKRNASICGFLFILLQENAIHGRYEHFFVQTSKFVLIVSFLKFVYATWINLAHDCTLCGGWVC